jgi:anti-anti-sigma regulatory factor
MKRHLMSSTTSQPAGDRDTAHAKVANGSDAARAHPRPHLTLVQTGTWSHTLILRGSLDRRSASELEDEIECLRQEGVAALTLDLRQLGAIDPRGAQVIASQSTPFKGPGPEFEVLVGSPVIQRVLAEAGWTDPSAPAPVEGVVRRFSRPAPQRVVPDLATTTIRDLGVDQSERPS